MMHKVYIASGSTPPFLPLSAPVKYSGCAADEKDAGFLKVECDCTELERFNVLQKSKLIKLVGSYPLYTRYADTTVVFFCCRAAVCLCSYVKTKCVCGKSARSKYQSHPVCFNMQISRTQRWHQKCESCHLRPEKDIIKEGCIARKVKVSHNRPRWPKVFRVG
jgi:hypothetical protein